MKYTNPVLKGFYPDPSVCRVGEDFFLVNSTFEFFPGVPVFHSKDLVHWKQIGHCINRSAQLKYATGSQSNTGIYAPTIRYQDGIYYMITTNVAAGGNFYVWTKDPWGEWSDPVFLGTPGIDPSLFFDEDGKSYYIGTDESIYVCEVDLKEGHLIGERMNVWSGSGGSYPEGPHLYKKDGWYYLMISEGGTERCHMITMARSRQLAGPYEECPYNPVLTNRSLPKSIEAVGHADLVQDQYGDWWAVCLGNRPISYPQRHNLGRETMLIPVDWNGEWPIFGKDGSLDEEIEVSRSLQEATDDWTEETVYQDDFTAPELDMGWNFIYNPDDTLWSTGGGALQLKGNEKSLSDAEVLAWVGRRQQHHACRAEVTLTFAASQEGEEAGLTIFLNNRHHYEAALMQKNGQRKLILRRQIGSLWKIEKEIPCETQTVRFELEADKENYTFYYTLPGKERICLGAGEVRYLTTEVGGCFTGNYIGLYAVGNGTPCKNVANFTEFCYQAI